MRFRYAHLGIFNKNQCYTELVGCYRLSDADYGVMYFTYTGHPDRGY